MITNHDPCFDVLFFRKLVVAESSSRCVYRCLLSATGAALAAHAAHEVACHLGDGRVVHHRRQIRHATGATGTATWTFSSSKAVAAWRTALKPAG